MPIMKIELEITNEQYDELLMVISKITSQEILDGVLESFNDPELGKLKSLEICHLSMKTIITPKYNGENNNPKLGT